MTDSIQVTEKDLPQRFTVKYLGKCDAKGLWGIKHTRTPVDIMVSFAKDRQISLPLVQLKVSKEGILMTPLNANKDFGSKKDTLDAEDEKEYDTNKKEKIVKLSDKQNLFFNIQQVLFKNTKRILKDNNDNIEKINKNVKNDSPNQENEKNLNICKSEKQREMEKKSFSFEKCNTFFGVDTISYGVQDLIYTRVFSMIVVNEYEQDQSQRHSSPFVCHAFVCDSRHTARKLTYSLAAAFLVYSQSVKLIKQRCVLTKAYREARPRKAAIDLRTPEDILRELRMKAPIDSEA